jgi:broad specificity phosphatase PhoE
LTVDVVLVRHASPVVARDVPARRWELDEPGAAAARALRGVLPACAFALTSDERKARETAMLAMPGASLTVDARVAETGRPDDWHGDFDARISAYLEGHSLVGWEPRAAVADRFDAAVIDGSQWSTGTVVVFTHGLAMTLWLQRIEAVADAAAFWSGLTLPDVWQVTVAVRDRRFRATGPAQRLL